MKKYIIFTLPVIICIACTKKTAASETTAPLKESFQEEQKLSPSVPDFEMYPVSGSITTLKVPLDFSSNPLAREYKTAISEAYKGSVTFAGHYIVVSWGCGTACIDGAIADVRDGKVYPLPRSPQGEPVFTYINVQPGSTLLITKFSGVPDVPAQTNYWDWNEKTKCFKLILAKKDEVQ